VDDRLTEGQRQVLALMLQNRKALIPGCTGSGKTLLAVTFAQQLERAGQKVLILCYNPFLAENLRARLPGGDIFISDFNAFVQTLLRTPETSEMAAISTIGQTRGVKPKYERRWTPFDEPTPYEIGLALSRLISSSWGFDAVIVDEGHEFKPEWWELVDSCLLDWENGRLAIFYDDNLSLYLFSEQLQAHPGAPRLTSFAVAPAVLTTDYRNGQAIYDLVQQLHPASPMSWDSAAGQGSVKEWIFHSEAELLPQVHAALCAAEQVSPRLNNFIVLSAENIPIQQSKLRGALFDAPILSASNLPGRIEWQKGLRQYLHRFGFVVEQLSQQPFPAGEDIRQVNQFCKNYFNQHRVELEQRPGLFGKDELVWSMDSYGALNLHWKQAERLAIAERELILFFSSPFWQQTLPKPHRRYRLSPGEDFATHPDDENLLLVDAPSFNGQEAEGVIFVFYNYFAEEQTKLLVTLYTGLSRARRWLYIVSPYSLLD